ncbi:hypothetical protein O3P69_008688 [Scylla paramamosain]|uniref:BAAT/Acyl-CoA thioester hydrolase C-terminal domain-containing protein n=1 Tax=Scylla paramamosain TaxID=85552 RepID=A0AAW0SMW6_SCYPA
MFADLAVERLRLAGKTNYTVKYPGAGQEPPYSTFCWASYHKMIRGGILWGGSLRPHADAQVHTWDALLTFFGKHLRNQTSLKGKL